MFATSFPLPFSRLLGSLLLLYCTFSRYTGTGDLLSALLLAHSAMTTDNLPKTLENIMNTMFSTIQRSLALMPEIPLDSKHPRGLMLIQCKDIIENPPEVFKAELMEI